MSATRPATELSIGIIASAARPLRTAAKASSKVAQASGAYSGYASLQAICELAPGSPWKAILPRLFELVAFLARFFLVMTVPLAWREPFPNPAACRRRAARHRPAPRQCACQPRALAAVRGSRAARAAT